MDKWLLSILLLSSSTSCTISQQLDSYMDALTQLNRFNGTVLVAQGDTILLSKGYGSACFEFDVPNTPQTYFRICSISKMLTAVAILQLQEKGLLRFDDTVNMYIDFPRAQEITVHHLLSHTSGLPSDSLPIEMAAIPTSLEKIVSFFKDKPLKCNPGEDFHYSNEGYYLLSYIIEKISGKKFESYCKEAIAKPSGMSVKSLDTVSMP